jgi:Cu-processing system permease protein
MKTLTIARLSFQEARQRWLLWAITLMGVAFIALFAIGFYFIHRDMTREASDERFLFEASNFLLMAGLYVVNFLMVMLAVLISVDTIAGEVASGTIHTIVTKPLRRWEVVLGKWLGLAVMLSVFTITMSAALMAIVWFIARYWPPYPAQGTALMVLGGLVVLTLSILGGTRLSTLANGVVVFMLYGLAFIAGWIEQIGAFVYNETAVDIGIIVSLLMPSEAMWRRAAYLMQPSLVRDLGVTPFSSSSAPSQAMVLYTVGYIVVTLLAALRLFQQRDL